MYTMYILQSLKNNRYYIGSTRNLVKRIHRHNSGTVLSTKAHLPWKLVYSETFETKGEASRRELQIKSWKKRVAIEKLINK